MAKRNKGQQGIKEHANKRGKKKGGKGTTCSLSLSWQPGPDTISLLGLCHPNTSNHTKQKFRFQLTVPQPPTTLGRKTESPLCPLLTHSLVGFYWDIHPPCAFRTRSSWTKPWTFPFCPVSPTGQGTRVQGDSSSPWWADADWSQ